MTSPIHELRRRINRLLVGEAAAPPVPAPPVAPPPPVMTPEPEEVKPGRVLRTDQEWLGVANQWLVLDTRIKALERKRTEVADRLAELHPEGSASGGGVDLTRYTPAGRVRTDDMTKALHITSEVVDTFRRPAHEVTSVRRTQGPSSGNRTEADPGIRAATFEKE